MNQMAMVTIERMSPRGWTAEIQYHTEFRAFLNARAKCMATGHVYRIINSKGEVLSEITLDDCKRQFQAR